MKVIIQIFVGTLCLAILGQSYLQACQMQKSTSRQYAVILSC